ncbi:hypothetical protein NRB_05510 [Novosphingobium sp. 11B]
MELAVDLIERAWRRLVRDRGANRLAADHPLQTKISHQPLYSAACNIEALALHLPPHFAHTVDAEVLGKDPQNFGLQLFILPGTSRLQSRVSLRIPTIARRHSDLMPRSVPI